MELHRDVPRFWHDSVGRVRVRNGLRKEVFAAHAEVRFGVRKHLTSNENQKRITNISNNKNKWPVGGKRSHDVNAFGREFIFRMKNAIFFKTRINDGQDKREFVFQKKKKNIKKQSPKKTCVVQKWSVYVYDMLLFGKTR